MCGGAMIVDIKMEGFKELSSLLEQLPVRVEKKVLQGAVTGAMREARKEIKAAAPKHLDKQSPSSKQYGTLQKNIRVIRLKRVRKGEKGARVDTGNAFWGYIYEMGSRYQAARPWFLPAFNRSLATIADTLRKRIADGIDREARAK